MLNKSSHIKDIDGYIFFSKNTVGTVGKPVKIHMSIFTDFFSVADPLSESGMNVIRQIENLRSHASTYITKNVPEFGEKNRNSIQTPRTPHTPNTKHGEQLDDVRATLSILAGKSEASFTTKNFRIFFYVAQHHNDKCPTIYVSQVKTIGSGSNEKGGLYEERASRRGISIQKTEEIRKNGKSTVFISSASESVEKAMESAKAATNNNTPLLYFTPDSVCEDLAIWKNNKQSVSTQESIEDLSKIIKKYGSDKENSAKQIDWVAEGEGAELLRQSLKNVPGKLKNFSFRFSNPRTNIQNLLETLKEKDANLGPEVIGYIGDRRTRFVISAQKEAILKQLGTHSFEGCDALTRRYQVKQLESLGGGNASDVVNLPNASRQKALDALNAGNSHDFKSRMNLSKENAKTFVDYLQTAAKIFR